MNIRAFVQKHPWRIGTCLVFALAFSVARLVTDSGQATVFGAALAGLAGALLCVAVWGERLRPQANVWWVLVTLLVIAGYAASWGGGVIVPLLRIIPMAFYVGFFLFTDHPLGPTVLLTAVVMSGLAPGFGWDEAGDGDAWALATSVLFGLFAAMLERERLQSLAGLGTPLAWTVVRGGFLTIWTTLIMTLKEDLQVGSFFASLGVDPRGEEGRLFLLALVLVCLAGAALLFRTRVPRARAKTLK